MPCVKDGRPANDWPEAVYNNASCAVVAVPDWLVTTILSSALPTDCAFLLPEDATAVLNEDGATAKSRLLLPL